MRWTVVAPFQVDEENRWLAPFVRGDKHDLTMIAKPCREAWHLRKGCRSGIGDWLENLSKARLAWQQSRGGIITIFPQLAMAVGLHRRASLKKKPIVAWCFNLGKTYGGLQNHVARALLHTIDCFVVHARAEIRRYADWLGLPATRFRFVPFQRSAIEIVEREEEAQPFLLAMGSAKRDYPTFFAAVGRLGYRTVVVAARRAIEGLDIPANVEVRSCLSSDECHRLAQRARINVVPIANDSTASGQVTIVEAMRMKRAVVATCCVGSEDYVEDGVTGLLVAPGDVAGLAAAIERLWSDGDLRRRLGGNAGQWTERHCSDEQAGASLEAILDEVAWRTASCGWRPTSRDPCTSTSLGVTSLGPSPCRGAPSFESPSSGSSRPQYTECR